MEKEKSEAKSSKSKELQSTVHSGLKYRMPKIHGAPDVLVRLRESTKKLLLLYCSLHAYKKLLYSPLTEFYKVSMVPFIGQILVGTQIKLLRDFAITFQEGNEPTTTPRRHMPQARLSEGSPDAGLCSFCFPVVGSRLPTVSEADYFSSLHTRKCS